MKRILLLTIYFVFFGWVFSQFYLLRHEQGMMESAKLDVHHRVTFESQLRKFIKTQNEMNSSLSEQIFQLEQDVFGFVAQIHEFRETQRTDLVDFFQRRLTACIVQFESGTAVTCLPEDTGDGIEVENALKFVERYWNLEL